MNNLFSQFFLFDIKQLPFGLEIEFGSILNSFEYSYSLWAGSIHPQLYKAYYIPDTSLLLYQKENDSKNLIYLQDYGKFLIYISNHNHAASLPLILLEIKLTPFPTSSLCVNRHCTLRPDK